MWRLGQDKSHLVIETPKCLIDGEMQHVLAMCMDNASLCDVIARTVGLILMDKYHLGFHEDNARVCCLAHVVNLVVQKILLTLGEAEDPDQDDYYVPNKHLPFHYDIDDDNDLREMEQKEDVEDDEDDEVEAWEIPDDIDEVAENTTSHVTAVKKVRYTMSFPHT